MHLSGRVGQGQRTHAGVRQGCPLSPTLFGMFLDGVQQCLECCCSQAAPKLIVVRRVPLLTHADVVNLIAQSESDLQVLITATHTFCVCIGYQICPEKSHAVVFSAPNAPQISLLCGEVHVQQLKFTKYPGLYVHQKRRLTCACDTFK